MPEAEDQPCVEIVESKAKPLLLTIALLLGDFDIVRNVAAFGIYIGGALIVALTALAIHEWRRFVGPPIYVLRIDGTGLRGDALSLPEDKVVQWNALRRFLRWADGDMTFECTDKRRFTIANHHIATVSALDGYIERRVEKVTLVATPAVETKQLAYFGDGLIPLADEAKDPRTRF